jgi:perosamine synthetase
MERTIAEAVLGENGDFAATSTSNGTTALHLVLLALGIGPGDEVIVPDFSYIAPVNAVLMCGATPVVVDVDEKSWCIDPKKIQGAISGKTKALIAVDNYGALADIRNIKSQLPSHISVIEDAAESFPSYPAERSKKFKGDFVTTSFYANKIVTSAEGGAITGPKNHIAKINSLKNQSVKDRGMFEHIDIGYNYRISNLHAALFVAQWSRLPEILENRDRVFNQYFNCLSQNNIRFASNQEDNRVNPWLMTIQLVDLPVPIEVIRSQLRELGIETRPGFKPASKHEYLRGKIRIAGDQSNSAKLHKEIISLPTFPELSDENIAFIVKALADALGR